MTRIEALKKLAEKVTGVRPTGRTIAQIINAIADNYSGGGGGGFIINAEGEITQSGDMTIDCTMDDIISAFQQNKEITVLVTNQYGNLYKFPFSMGQTYSMGPSGYGGQFVFSCTPFGKLSIGGSGANPSVSFVKYEL